MLRVLYGRLLGVCIPLTLDRSQENIPGNAEGSLWSSTGRVYPADPR